MGLYDDEEIMGADDAHAERQRRLAPLVVDITARLHKLEPLVLTDRAPNMRSLAMAPIAQELEDVVAKSTQLGALSTDNAALVDAARAIVARARDDEAAQIAQRRRDELALLAEQLELREAEIAENKSVQSVAQLHLATIAARLAELASTHGIDAALALATRAERSRANVADDQGADPRNKEPGRVGPSWAEVEGAVTVWLDNAWHEKVFRVEREEPGMSAALVRGVSVHDVAAKVYAVAAFGAVMHRVRIGLATTDGGWTVTSLSVRA